MAKKAPVTFTKRQGGKTDALCEYSKDKWPYKLRVVIRRQDDTEARWRQIITHLETNGVEFRVPRYGLTGLSILLRDDREFVYIKLLVI